MTRIKASVRTLTDLQENLRVACKWLYACAEMRLLEVEGDSTWVYLVTDLPWPAHPRDIVLRVRTERLNDGTLMRYLSAEPGRVPAAPGLIRVRRLRGEWTMRPLGEKETEVSYQLQADPAGDGLTQQHADGGHDADRAADPHRRRLLTRCLTLLHS